MLRLMVVSIITLSLFFCSCSDKTENINIGNINSKHGSIAVFDNSLYVLYNGILYNTNDYEHYTVLPGKHNKIYENGKTLYSNSNDSIANAEKNRHLYSIEASKFIVDGNYIYYINPDDHLLNKYDITYNINTNVTTFPIINFYINTDYIACLNIDGIEILDKNSDSSIHCIESNVNIVDFYLDQHFIYYTESALKNKLSNNDWTIRVYDIRTEESNTLFESKGKEQIISFMIANNDHLLFCVMEGQRFCLNDINRSSDEKYITRSIELDSHNDIYDILFDGKYVILLSFNGVVNIIDIDNEDLFSFKVK